ncbi:MAG TPA: hypothetical protein VJT72_22920 [Pseudonocardiaceae bacterium]|nr:hypothetical protein [Pseudonocardiaceae bacterium]
MNDTQVLTAISAGGVAGALLAALAAVYAGSAIARWGVHRIHHRKAVRR